MAALWLSSPPETFPRPSLPPTLSPTPSAPILPATRRPLPSSSSPWTASSTSSSLFPLALSSVWRRHRAHRAPLPPPPPLVILARDNVLAILAILKGLFSVDWLSPIVRVVPHVAESSRPRLRLLIRPNTLNTSSAARRLYS
ncbi:hypothetical protein L210DRAFT_3642848 [Boletus edulis BED1]|uniref:Uncharacterized protein n=1 Tax=Boletus edulis BED1 TaxID=1328754 RepID=A0AAD4BZS0_BOLED|nr:hypothetical protein L210DRAFT_3653793 [Boletus edulis BED1]KAF8444588.1 hypothetical protein L210DRAFT_3642848 [Boletus edulis BED1]